MKGLVSCMAAASMWFGMPEPSWGARHTHHRFLATAFSAKGITAAGTKTKIGVVAADPDSLPLGTRIRVTGAGRYSGTYLVADTGGRIEGRHIDIYLPSAHAARRFGRRWVRVTVLKWGRGKKSAARAERAYPQAFGPGVRTTPRTAARSSR